MKKYIVFGFLAAALSTTAQTKPTKSAASFELGSGLNFSFNDDAYQFRISGMVQPYIGIQRLEDSEADYYFNSRRSYFNIGGRAVEERVSFFVQLDFSLSDPLLDAWIGFHPTDRINIYVGQKQSIANNREMQVMETYLQFPGRSLLSTQYSKSGREFGVFFDYRLGSDGLGIVPQVAFTSGDGRNSFGTDSRDIDVGGFKYAARVDLYPLGFFASGNDQSMADLAHEDQFKFVIGGAASYNDGASEAVGEGHGVFALYNMNGGAQQPDYRQVYGDILMKYKGFSFLGEYVVATAANLDGTFKNETGSNELLPTEISEYLALGTGFNLQAGYTTQNGYGMDARYFGVMPEFDNNADSFTQESSGFSVGVSKYFVRNACKIQAAYTQMSPEVGPSTSLVEVLFQVIF